MPQYQKPIRAIIDEPELREFIAGRPVTVRSNGGLDIQIVLRDIGWDRIRQAVDDAISDAPTAHLWFSVEEPISDEPPDPEDDGAG